MISTAENGGDILGDFPARLKRLRHRNKYNRYFPQYKLSELCGLGSDCIRKYEAGERGPEVEPLMAIADFFEVSTDYLLGRTDCPNIPKSSSSQNNF